VLPFVKKPTEGYLAPVAQVGVDAIGAASDAVSSSSGMASTKGLPSLSRKDYNFGLFPLGGAVILLIAVILIFRRRRLADKALIEKTNV